MSTLERTEKRKFANKLKGVGSAATIRENVVKDLRESSVLVRWSGIGVHILPVLSVEYFQVHIFAHTQAMMRVLFCYLHLFKCGYMCPVMFALVVITRSDDSCVDLRRTVVNCLMIGAVAPTNVCADRWLLA